MIHTLHGTITNKGEKFIVCQAGDSISFGLAVADESRFVLNKKTDVFVHMHWNQEQGPTLYGFATEHEKTLFVLVTSCQGIGPKLALTMIGHMSPDQLMTAIIHNDAQTLSSIPGIGAKKAEQVCFALKSKVEKLLASGAMPTDSGQAHHWKELMDALESLKYSRPEINKALDHLRQAELESATFDHLLRKALAFLSKPSL